MIASFVSQQETSHFATYRAITSRTKEWLWKQFPRLAKTSSGPLELDSWAKRLCLRVCLRECLKATVGALPALVQCWWLPQVLFTRRLPAVRWHHGRPTDDGHGR